MLSIPRKGDPCFLQPWFCVFLRLRDPACSHSKPGQRRKWRQPFETVGQYMWNMRYMWRPTSHTDILLFPPSSLCGSKFGSAVFSGSCGNKREQGGVVRGNCSLPLRCDPSAFLCALKFGVLSFCVSAIAPPPCARLAGRVFSCRLRVSAFWVCTDCLGAHR